MRHVTKYCNLTVPHCTVRRDTACIRSSPDPLPSLAEVGRACETNLIPLCKCIVWIPEPSGHTGNNLARKCLERWNAAVGVDEGKNATSAN